MDNRTIFAKIIIKGLKILLYLSLAIFVGVISNPDFHSWISAQPKLAAFLVIINIVLGVSQTVLQHFLDTHVQYVNDINNIQSISSNIVTPQPAQIDNIIVPPLPADK